MRMRWAWLFVWLVALPPLARAQSALDTCVHVTSTAADAVALDKLVRMELDRHPTHRASEPPCAQELYVELIGVGGELYLTGRVAGHVPHRVRVGDGRLDLAVSSLLRVVLGNDPLVLRDPKSGDWFSRALFGLRRRAHPLWGLEAAERWVFAGGTPRSLPVLSAHYRREVDRWQLGVRVEAAAWLSGRFAPLHPTLIVSILPELAWFTSRTAAVAGFISIGAGISHQRFEGPRRDEPGARATSARTGLLLSPRLGVELFRTTDTRFLLFAEAGIPAFSARDAQKPVVRGFTPSLSVGAGVSF
jgi:hypothetical protein